MINHLYNCLVFVPCWFSADLDIMQSVQAKTTSASAALAMVTTTVEPPNSLRSRSTNVTTLGSVGGRCRYVPYGRGESFYPPVTVGNRGQSGNTGRSRHRLTTDAILDKTTGIVANITDIKTDDRCRLTSPIVFELTDEEPNSDTNYESYFNPGPMEALIASLAREQVRMS